MERGFISHIWVEFLIKHDNGLSNFCVLGTQETVFNYIVTTTCNHYYRKMIQYSLKTVPSISIHQLKEVRNNYQTPLPR